MAGNGNMINHFSSSLNFFSSYHADQEEGKDKAQSPSYLPSSSSAGKLVPSSSFLSSCSPISSLEGQFEKISSTSKKPVGGGTENDQKNWYLRKNYPHKDENMIKKRKMEASQQKEDPPQDLKIIDIEDMIKQSRRPPLSSEHCCIYRVSHGLHEANQKAYTPRTVSIGPLHHKNKHLKGMQDVKVRYLEQLCHRVAKTANLKRLRDWVDQEKYLNWKNVDDQIMDDLSCLNDFLGILKSSEDRIRQSYAEDLNHLTSKDLLKIILVDAGFIIELFLRYHFKSQSHGDAILSTPFLLASIRMDLWLLENQIPFFVLEDLYKAAFESYKTIYAPRFLDLAHKFFETYDAQKRPIEIEIKHFTDLLRTFFLPTLKAEEKGRKGKNHEENCSDRILKIFTGFLRCCGLLSKPLDQKERSYFELEELGEQLKSATQLHAAGLVFSASSSKCLLDIKFSNPKLEIPCLHLYDDTEAVFRNLMALEQYHYPTEALICDYVTVMDYLINTSEDVGLLVEKQIIKNWLGSNEKVASLFNKLCTNIFKGFINERFYHLIKDLNAYYVKPWHSWKATFWRQYFSTPWRGASTIAAIILLVLTLAQTILTAVAM